MCPRCGTSTWEWDEDPHAYTAVEWRCLGCQKLDAKQKELGEKKRTGMHVGLMRRRR